MQIDVYIYGVGTFDYRIYLCRIYKVIKSCVLDNNLIWFYPRDFVFLSLMFREVLGFAEKPLYHKELKVSIFI